MKHGLSSVSSCRHCQFYSPQGRRGGHCKKLNVSVKSQWDACSLATPPFVAGWAEIENIAVWTHKPLRAEEVALSADAPLKSDFREKSQEVTVSVPVMSNLGASPWI